MASVGLSMIVKNEAPVVLRCLESVAPHISHWTVVDTGSTDGTQELVRGALAAIPGEVVDRPWKGFAHNRTEALDLARTKADYSLMVDADEVLHVDGGTLPSLGADAYRVLHRQGDCGFHRTQITKNKFRWRYVGDLHSTVECKGHVPRVATLEGAVLRNLQDGARGSDGPERYLRDAQKLLRSWERKPDARTAFYIAQSYRDAGQREDALEWYARRVELGGWPEEVWYSLYQIAALTEQVEPDRAVEAYLRAYNFRPSRMEALVRLSALMRSKRQYAAAHLFAARAYGSARPDDSLFVDEATYEWRTADEYALASYYVGDKAESARVCKELIESDGLPVAQQDRMFENLRFADPSAVAVATRPWMAAADVEALESIVQKQWKVFEFGSGGSSVFFARRCARVCSLEHVAEWRSAVLLRLCELSLAGRAVIHCVPSSEADGGVYDSGRRSYQAYVAEGATLVEHEQPDLVLVDGRARVECVRATLAVSAPRVVVLDDAQRERYGDAKELLRAAGYELQGGHRAEFWHLAQRR